MTTVTIPTDYNPYVIEVNNTVYRYKAGETVEVPDEVAAVLRNIGVLTPREAPPQANIDDVIAAAQEATEAAEEAIETASEAAAQAEAAAELAQQYGYRITVEDGALVIGGAEDDDA